ncbi:glycosyltransferase family 4 protein [Demequina lignilytica]|uniref:D-inositol 3-phosphate glycosyltransferase n=1 Tax=Demequina lignilytica TaxID=3051663 RepID=A0AB35MK52_9MICO|nr:glycosyltransferase family 4 protein [Demequina sp. SYSU T0a273]MDN4484164.1 glycosyltransferase family 4 protein [Demequina sp. SYSU T0a273]
MIERTQAEAAPRPTGASPRPLRIGLVADGPLDSPRTNSGVAKGIREALERAEGVEVVCAESTRPTGLAMAWVRLRAFRLPVDAWRNRSRHSPTARRLTDRARDRVVATHPDLDLLIHVRNTYAPATLPYAAFIDSTSEQSRRWASWSVWADQLVAAEREYYGRAALVLTAGREAARSAIEDYGVDPARVHAVGGGTNFPAAVAARAAQRRPGPLRVLFVGVEFERKGGDLAVEAVRRLRERGVEVELTAVTKFPPAPSVGLTVREPIWDRAELSRVYADHDVFCLPARYEPYGLVVQEAMAHAMPVVVSSTGSLPDIVTDGATGIVVPDGEERGVADVDAIADALADLAGDLDRLATMGVAARERALSELTWDAVARRMIDAVRGWRASA